MAAYPTLLQTGRKSPMTCGPKISGSRLEFWCTQCPTTKKQTRGNTLGCREISSTITRGGKYCSKGVHTDSREGYTSPIFLVPKSDGSWHTVESLNKYVVTGCTCHFKMESIRTVKGLMQKGDWLVNLKDSYFTISIHPSHQKYLRFQWEGQI